MSNLNEVGLVGRLVREVELEKSSSGISFAHITLAVDDYENKKEIAYFIPVNVVGKSAEAVSKYVKKGDYLGISGKIVQHTYSDKTGSKKSQVSVLATGVMFLNGKKEEQPKPVEGISKTDDNLPF